MPAHSEFNKLSKWFVVAALRPL